jgi:hypothetical protein
MQVCMATGADLSTLELKGTRVILAAVRNGQERDAEMLVQALGRALGIMDYI